MKKIELLAPAKNIDFGKIAINHGADAVYIGAPKFGARSAVGNSISEIEQLVSYAHLYNAKVYATLNTLLFDNELDDASKIIHQLYSIGVDALIIQDMGILELDLPPISLHASTQTHNYTPEKVQFLENIGFQRAILARELSLEQIKEIRSETTIELEAFIHGALCVCFSGQCYMSYALNKRSGNRGNCSQPCRSAYNLTNESGDILVKDSHLLSLKDFNASDKIEQLLDAGISSFKIEGRLKDESYLKNVTSFYRKKLDSILEGTDFQRASSGRTTFLFEPDLEKTFNRGYTEYFLNGRKEKTGSLLTQKSIGKKLGIIRKVEWDFFELDTDVAISNGDGLCFIDKQNKLDGFLVNKVEGRKIYPNKSMPDIELGVEIFRNNDFLFEKQLQGKSSERKIAIKCILSNDKQGFFLEITDEDTISVKTYIQAELILAKNNETAISSTQKQLSKTGDTPFLVKDISIETDAIFFIPAAVLNELRRNTIERLIEKRISVFSPKDVFFEKNSFPYHKKEIDYRENILNKKAEEFYIRHGVENFEWGFEKQNDFSNKFVMKTKHCIKYQLEQCPVYFKELPSYKQKLFLENNKNRFELAFDCKQCMMRIKTS
ncbi:U32 family peptidase [Bacteroidales bacterium OttesenSCG-928-C19]|nr:U32 family peptidase [Bacteroidales bacterium OttesenSCG-928-C19]